MTYRQAGETLPAFSMETDGKMPEKPSKNIYIFLKKGEKGIDKIDCIKYNCIKPKKKITKGDKTLFLQESGTGQWGKPDKGETVSVSQKAEIDELYEILRQAEDQ